jgi:23S rRNA (cytidine1920-2'-O)/16S rRNA (cytidine1409-2'-O)-methyltransferase
MRLDIYLTKEFKLQSRNKASEFIKQKKVQVDGKIVTKPSFIVFDTMEVALDQEQLFVSRAAYKLHYFLQQFPIQIENKDAIDVGSSTGGFTQILLNNGAKSVTCVDVGSNQLHKTLCDDPRIVIQENTDIREFIPIKKYEILTCDVSFISILNIIKHLDKLNSKEIIILYKPQFEVGREVKRDKNGVVQDQKAIEKVKEEFLLQTKKLQWRLQYQAPSKLLGKNGNAEELFYFTK